MSVARLMVVLGLCYAAFLANQVQLIQQYGGLQSYIDTFVKLRRTLELADRSFIETFILTASLMARDLILMLTAVLFALRGKGAHWVWVLVLLGLAVSLSTFYRGTIFVYMLMLAAGEQQRLQLLYSETKRANGGYLASARAGAAARNALVSRPAFLVVLAFMGLTAVGAVRTFLAGPLWGATVTAQESLRAELDRFIEGPGLYGLTAIMEHFPAAQDFMDGQTIFHQLARWVPRAIWSSKPEAYGASEIHAALGYPESTLSAITIPGEFYANFGPSGVLLMLVVGFFVRASQLQPVPRHLAILLCHCRHVACHLGRLVLSYRFYELAGSRPYADRHPQAVFRAHKGSPPKSMEISADSSGNMLLHRA